MFARRQPHCLDAADASLFSINVNDGAGGICRNADGRQRLQHAAQLSLRGFPKGRSIFHARLHDEALIVVGGLCHTAQLPAGLRHIEEDFWRRIEAMRGFVSCQRGRVVAGAQKSVAFIDQLAGGFLRTEVRGGRSREIDRREDRQAQRQSDPDR